MTTILSIIITALIIGLLVFIHELGHFLAAKSVGVKVEKFAIGFGPKLFSWKPGETEYSLRLIMLGGFVQMYGDADPSSMTSSSDESLRKDPRSYLSKNTLEKIWITVAGVAVNFIFAVLVFMVYLGMVSNVVPLPKVVDYGFIGANTEENLVIVSDLFGVESEDTGIVLEIDGREEFTSREELISFLEEVENEPVEVNLFRNNSVETSEIILNGDGYQSNLDLDFFPSNLEKVSEVYDLNQEETIFGRLRVLELGENSALSAAVEESQREDLVSSYLMSVDGEEIYAVGQLNQLLEGRLGEQDLELGFLDNEGNEFTVEFDVPEEKDDNGAILGVALGVYQAGFEDEAYLLSYDNSVTGGLSHTVNVIGYNMKALGVLIGDAFQGEPQALAENVGSIGTVGMEVDTILGASQEIGGQALVQILNLTAVISAILAFMNILPIPILDGGNVVFILIEAIRGKPLPEKIINAIYMVFFGLIILLSVVLIGLDFIKILF